MNLLLIEYDQNDLGEEEEETITNSPGHYFLIKDLSAFLRFRYGPNSREHKFVCFKCLKGTHSLASMNAHRYLCTNTYTQFEEMPPTILRFLGMKKNMTQSGALYS